MTDAEFILDELNEILISRKVDIYDGTEPQRIFDMEVIAWIRDYVKDVNPLTQITWELSRGVQRLSFTTSILHMVAHCCEQIQLFKILRNTDMLATALNRDSAGNTLLHLLIFFNAYEVFEYIYKNCFESLPLTEITNHQGQTLQYFLSRSNNKHFMELINKYRRIDENLNKQLLSNKDQFHDHLVEKIEFEPNAGYPNKIKDSFLLMNYIMNNFQEHQFDEILIESHQLSYAHVLFLLGDLKMVQLMLNNMPNLHKYKCFMLKDILKNTLMHYAAHFKNEQLLSYCFEYYLEFLIFPINSIKVRIWDIIKEEKDLNPLLKFRQKYDLMKRESEKYDLDRMLSQKKTPEEIFKALATSRTFYDSQKDPVILNVDEEFTKWFMQLEDNSLWETVVHNILNLRVSHIVFLTNKEELIRKMLNNLDKKQKMSILNKKDNFSNTPLHYMAYFGNYTIIKYVFYNYEDFIFVNTSNAKKLTINKIAQIKNFKEIANFANEYEKKLTKIQQDSAKTNQVTHEPKVDNYKKTSTKELQKKSTNEFKKKSTNEFQKKNTNELNHAPKVDNSFPVMPSYDYGYDGKYLDQKEPMMPNFDYSGIDKYGDDENDYKDHIKFEDIEEIEEIEETPAENEMMPNQHSHTPRPEQRQSSRGNKESNFFQIRETEEENKQEEEGRKPINTMHLDEYLQASPHPDLNSSFTAFINYIIATLQHTSLYDHTLQLAYVDDPQFVRCISECLEHIQFNSVMVEPQVLFIHTILITMKEDLIFYSLKKWELKDTAKYNIFALRESTGMDLLSLLIMGGSLTLVRHIFDNYGSWINFSPEGAQAYIQLAKDARQPQVANYLIKLIDHAAYPDSQAPSTQRELREDHLYNQERLLIDDGMREQEMAYRETSRRNLNMYRQPEPVQNLRMSRSFHDMGYERDMDLNMNKLPKVKGNYRPKRHQVPQMQMEEMDSDSNESVSDMYIKRLNKYQYKIEDLSYKYSKNLQKLNMRFNNKKTIYGQPFQTSYRTNTEFGETNYPYMPSLSNTKYSSNINYSTKNSTPSQITNNRNKTQNDSILPDINKRVHKY